MTRRKRGFGVSKWTTFSPDGLCLCGCRNQTRPIPSGPLKGRPRAFFSSGHAKRASEAWRWTRKHGDDVPKICGCGCGLTTPRAVNGPNGQRKGRYLDFIKGHNNRESLPRIHRRVCACGCGEITARMRNKYVHGHNRRTLTLAQRFWAMVQKTETCWLWTGATTSGPLRYGVIMVRERGRRLRASRLSWELDHGSIPDDKLALHKCDNPLCVRPDHLFLGDHADNARDKVAKGRQLHGERHRHTRLTATAVLEIRRSPKDTLTRRYLAAKFGVSNAVISNVDAGRSWRHVHDGGVA